MIASETRITFIGIGAMGSPMAACLLRAGFDVTVFDISNARMEDFVAKHGGKSATDLQFACAQADIVVMILPNSAVVRQVLLGPEGITSVLKAGTVVIDMTSGVPHVTVELNKLLANQQVIFFDAPVSGAVARAEVGDLTIMVGGQDHEIEPVVPVLRVMGQVTRTGAIGSGDAMKALNNLVSCGGYLIGIETLLIGTRFGLEPAKMLEVLNTSTGMNNSTQKKFGRYVLSRKFDSGFPIHMMLKDLNNATDLAHDLGVTTPFSQLCRDLWAGASTMLGPEVDHTAVAWLSEAMAGSQISVSE
jgi:3-hydroxyisobutyrate dehydrogenase